MKMDRIDPWWLIRSAFVYRGVKYGLDYRSVVSKYELREERGGTIGEAI